VVVVNQGVISADVSQGTIYIVAQPFSNAGSLKVSSGTVLSIDYGVTLNDPGLINSQFGGTLQMGGSLLGNTHNSTQYSPQGNLTFTSGTNFLEAMSSDMGKVAAGYVNNFAYGSISLQSGVQVTLVDQYTNSSATSPECVYVNSLVVPSGSTLNLNGLHLYTRLTQISGTISGGTVSQVPDNGGPLTLGVNTPGSITNAGALDEFTFFGRGGQLVTVAVDTGGGNVLPPQINYADVQLLDPSSNLLSQASNTVAGAAVALTSVKLPTDGTYLLYVHAPANQSSSTGNYLVTVWDATPNVLSLVLNQMASSRINTPYSVDQWNFSAGAAQQVTFDLVNLTAPGVAFDFNGPNGWNGFSNLMASSGLITLPYSGNYTITAHGTGGGYEIAYAFDLVTTAQTNLMVGSSFQGNLAGSGQAQLFVFTLTNASPMLITLGNTGAGNVAEIYVGIGSPPTRGAYNYHATVANSSSQQVLIPEADSGTYYVLVYGNQIATPGAYTITATTAGLFLTSSFPPSLGAGADAVLTLSGAGFDPSTTVQLIAASGPVYSPRSVSVNSFSQITATFAANSVPVGLYSVLVTKAGGSSAELTNVFQLTPGAQGNLVTQLIVPGVVGRHAPSTLYIEYANTGNAAMPAPLLLLTCSQTPIMGVAAALSPVQQQEAFWTSVLPPAWSTNVQLLASGKIPGVLQPGESNIVAISYGGLLQPWQPVNSVQFNLGVLGVTNTTPVDWNSYESSMQPANLATDAWAAIYQNFTDEMGPNWGSYNQSLDNASSYLGQLGLNVTDIGRLVSFEFQRADAMNIVRYLAGGLDAYVPTPGVALSFQRVFAENISGRYQLGALGRGWSHNWDLTLSNATSSVTILGPGTSIRTFLVNTLGGYYNSPGDYGQLTSLGSGAFTLQEASGIVEVFRTDGKLNYVQDPNGNRIACGYTGNQLTSLTHSSGQSLTITYNGFGMIASITDSLGRQTTFGYDASGQHLISATYFDGSTVAYSYTDPATAAANPTLAHALTQITTPTTNHEYIAYDTQGRLANLSLDGGAQSLSFSYDTVGTVFVTDANSHTTTFYLNNNGLVAKVQNPFTNSVFFAYDANYNLTTFTDPTGRSYNYAYDDNGNLTQFTDTLGKTANFAYQSPFNRLASLVDDNANLTTYGNDSSGNLRSITYADSSAEDWGYDMVGNPTTWTNRRGQSVVYQFNNSGQPISKVYPDGRTITYSYNGHSLVTNVADSVQGVTKISYDARDNVTNITYPNGRGFSFAYDSDGHRTSRIGFDGYTLNYGYDVAGRLATLTDGSNNQLVRYTYDASGRLSTETKGNGTVATYGYNSAGQLVALTNAAPGGGVQSFFNYTYDAKGNRLTMTDSAGVTSYTYDDLNQLTGVSYPSARHVTYAYDAMGNRTAVNDTATNTTYTANSLNEYIQSGGTVYGYDADGNMASQTTPSGTTTYQYDAENRLVSVITPTNGTWQYVCDALGNRSATVYNGVTNQFLVDPFGLVDVAAEYNSGGNLAARYDHGLGLVARVDNGGNAAFYSFDALGNTRQITGTGGTILNAYDYDAFGAATSESESVSNVFRFVGRFGVADEGTGLHFMRKRFYDSSLGRFCSKDPIGINGGIDLYSYAANNPVNNSDPHGTDLGDDLLGHEFAWPFEQFIDRYFGWLKGINWSNLGKQGYGVPSGDNSPNNTGDGSPYNPNTPTPYNPPYNPNNGNGNNGGGGFGNGGPGSSGPGNANPITPPSTSTTTVNTGIGTVQDPNQLIGPSGYGILNFVADGNLLAYEVIFANETNATAPAQIVKVTDSLSTNLDWTTFQLTGIAFGTQFISIPPGVQYFQTNITMSYNGVSFQLQIQAGINLGTGQVFANFNSIDPTTGLPPPVNVGFLPPENGTGIGTGHISYTIRAKPGVPTDVQISNVALISFDNQPTIATDQIDDSNPAAGIATNKQATITIDSVPPTSAVQPLPTNSPSPFMVCWSGTDDPGGSGIGSYTIYVSDNGGAWNVWLANTTNTCASYSGVPGHAYAFFSAATDNAGNLEAVRNAADTQTTVLLSAISDEFRITAITREGNNIRVTWICPAGSTNALQSTRAAGYAGYTNAYSDISPAIVMSVPGMSTTNYLDAGVAYAPVLISPGGQIVTTSAVPSTVAASAQYTRGLVDSLGNAAPVDSLLMLGTFSISESTIQSNFYAGNLSGIMSNFTPYSTSFAVGNGTGLPASWNVSESAAGFGGKQIYLLAVNKPTLAAADHLGIFTAPSWVFPADGSQITIDLQDVTDFVIGAQGGPLTIGLGLGQTYTFSDTAKLSYLPGRILFYRVRLVQPATITDSVGDSIPDSWRAQYFPSVLSNTTNAQSCAACDADGTGQNNMFKYVAGLDPTNPHSVFVFQIAPVLGQPNWKDLIYNPVTSGRTYAVQTITNLVGGVYTNLTGFGGPVSNGTQVTVTDQNAVETNKFYRLHISLP
jgi:RHS repeat-associated protein